MSKKPKKKQPKKKRQAKPKSKYAPREFTTQQREQMFLDWFECRSMRAVARAYKMAESTLYRIKNEDDWNRSMEEALSKLRKKTVTKAVSAANKRLKITQGIHNKVARRIANAPDAELDLSVRDYVILSKYLDELEGDRPVAERSEIVFEIIQRLETSDATERERFLNNTLVGLGFNGRDVRDRLSKIRASLLSPPHRN